MNPFGLTDEEFEDMLNEPENLHVDGSDSETEPLDGSEDDMIHCFKQHGPVPEGREMLREARIANAEIDLTNEPEEDPDESRKWITF
ncbi:hypothetical protein DdX_08351 [Ditylenchus destructor]|uniref:Uncharacterized protein n=1 Tax=Ditylenchus destructor TaxID=166010 RepID=A0AAD4N4B8_9BILA|nr:hypothetical protein DdX_08351 [Ditylenchus destructor]